MVAKYVEWFREMHEKGLSIESKENAQKKRAIERKKLSQELFGDISSDDEPRMSENPKRVQQQVSKDTTSVESQNLKKKQVSIQVQPSDVKQDIKTQRASPIPKLRLQRIKTNDQTMFKWIKLVTCQRCHATVIPTSHTTFDCALQQLEHQLQILSKKKKNVTLLFI